MKDLPAGLEGCSAEEVIRAFLIEAEPFVMMWSDLLKLFERAAATSGQSNLQISYSFDDELPGLSFDLEHFRRDVRRAQEMVARHWFTDNNLGSAWGLARAFEPIAGGLFAEPDSGIEEVDTFVDDARDGAQWPRDLPLRPSPSTPDPPFEALVEETWDLAARFLDGLRTSSTNHSGLQRDRSDTGPLLDEAPFAAVRQLESDYWLPALVRTVAQAAASASTALGADELGIIEGQLEHFRNHHGHRDLTSVIDSLLALPVWQHRYELYSNWVAAQVVEALKERSPTVHSDEGALEFRFGGTHLATFDGYHPRLHLWTELRAPLDNPVGKGRSAGVQPDITLRLDPLTSDRSPAVIECKHYGKPKNKEFGQALTDYARAHAGAHVTLVNHGRLNNATVLRYVASEVADRTSSLGDLRPDRPLVVQQFHDWVRTNVREFERPDLHLAAEDESATEIGPANDQRAAQVNNVEASVTLNWNAPPRDLDLWVAVPGPAGPTRVGWADKGKRFGFPYCALDRDVTDATGPETITIYRLLPGRYDVGVDVYDDHRHAPGSTVIVQVGEISCVFMWPEHVTGPRWHVCTIEGDTGQITVSSPGSVLELDSEGSAAASTNGASGDGENG